MLGVFPYQSDNHRVEVEEEQDEMEPQFDEALPFVSVQRPEDLGSIQHVLIIKNPIPLLTFFISLQL